MMKGSDVLERGVVFVREQKVGSKIFEIGDIYSMLQTACGGPIEQLPTHLFDCVQHFLLEYLPIIPAAIPFGRLTTVLDVGCGMNQWGKALFRAMDQVSHELVADVRIEGIDHHPSIVRASQASTRTGRTFVLTSLGDMTHLPIDRTRHYDLVHARFLSPYLAPQLWLPMLSEMMRVCKRDGWIVWLEPTMPTKGQNTPGWNQWLDWVYQAVRQLGGSPWIIQSMEILMQQAGLGQIRTETYLLPLLPCTLNDAILSSQQYQLLCADLKALFPLLLAAQVANEQQLKAGQHRMLNELYHEKITSQWEWKLVIGKKA